MLVIIVCVCAALFSWRPPGSQAGSLALIQCVLTNVRGRGFWLFIRTSQLPRFVLVKTCASVDSLTPKSSWERVFSVERRKLVFVEPSVVGAVPGPLSHFIRAAIWREGKVMIPFK